MLDEANNTLTRAIEALPGEGSEEDINKYLIVFLEKFIPYEVHI